MASSLTGDLTVERFLEVHQEAIREWVAASSSLGKYNVGCNCYDCKRYRDLAAKGDQTPERTARNQRAIEDSAKLLWSHLDDHQRREVFLSPDNGLSPYYASFSAHSKLRDLPYTVYVWGSGVSGNCIRAVWDMTPFDLALTYKLWIEADEETFAKVANSSADTFQVQRAATDRFALRGTYASVNPLAAAL